MDIDISKMPAAKRRAFVRAHRGILSRIARNLDPPITPAAVFQVLHRKSKSARIKKAIEQEIARLLRQEAKQR